MTRRWVVLTACVAAYVSVAIAAPQSQIKSQLEIRGLVLQAGTNQPLVDAEVSLSVQEPGPVRINGGWKLDEARKARTDYSGAFRMTIDKLGPYRVEAKKAGHLPPGERGATNYREVRLTDDAPVADVRLYLVLPGSVAGRVVDAASGGPVAKLKLIALRVHPVFGFEFSGPAGVTNAAGEFEIGGLAPGEYAVEIRPQVAEDKRLSLQLAKDAKPAEPDWEHTYWPGGHGADAAIPVTVTAGATTSVAKITARKVPYHRVHLPMPDSECNSGEKVVLMELFQTARGGTGQHGLGSVACSKGIYVSGFAAGTYRLAVLVGGRSADTAASATVAFTMVDENLELDAPLQRGVAVAGALVAEDGATLPDLAKVRVGLRAVDGFMPAMDSGMPVVPSADGQFQFAGVRLADQSVMVNGLDAGHYVKEIRYNGARAAANIVTPQGGALAHKVVIVIDDKPGTIIGTVMSGEQAIGGAVVIARRWPPAKDGWGTAGGRSDATGQFRLGGLAPGEYRAVAVRTIELGMDAAIERQLAAAKTIEVTASGVTSVRLAVK